MTTRRYFAIDHLRTAMMFVVMFGHPLLPYITVPRSFKDDSTHVGFDVIAVFLYAFAMQAFFVTAGFTAALILARKGTAGLWRNRLSRIFIPLVVAYIIITPLMRGAYDFAKAVVEFDSITLGWSVFIAADWLRWSKLYHLWFLLSLLVFTAMALATLWLIDRSDVKYRLDSWLADKLIGYSGIGFLSLLVVCTTIPSYVLETGSGTHWSMQITLFAYFALGWFIYGHQQIIVSWQTHWQRLLLISLMALPLCAWASRIRWFDEHNIDLVIGLLAGATNGIIGICMTIALLGFFHAKLERPSPIAKVLTEASYWVYLIHFPIVVAAGGLVAVLDIPAVFKYLLTLSISIPTIALSYYVIVLKTPLKHVIAGKS